MSTKVFLINSFNSKKYVTDATKLSEEIENLGFRSIIVYGGASQFLPNYAHFTLKLSEKRTVISIPENLSDNNAFVGFSRAFNDGHFTENEYKDALYVYIHDTCKISDHFVNRINDLPCVKGWVFAHIYGLYNIGVCDQIFILNRARDFIGIKFIPKDKSIALEQGEKIVLEQPFIYFSNTTIEIQPLIYYSTRTLSMVINTNMHNCDMMSLNAFMDSSGCKRYVTFIASLGIYKFVGSHVSYFVPIWASPSHEVKNQDDYEDMKKSFSQLQLSTSEYSIGSITPWVPLSPLNLTST